jgi:signal transduction histidine kinase
MITVLAHTNQTNSPGASSSPMPAELISDEDFHLPVELAAHISDCQVAAISFLGVTKYFVRKGLAEWLGFPEVQQHHYKIPSQCDHILIVADMDQLNTTHAGYQIHLPAQIQFLASVPIKLDPGFKSGCLTVMGVEKRDGLSETQVIALEKIAQQIGRLVVSKLQNKQLLEHKNDLLQAASKKTELKTEEFRQELKYIAYKMHEDFAQTLAATKLYLEFAEDEQHTNKHFLQISKDTIEQVIQKMRTLCRTIAPHQIEST